MNIYNSDSVSSSPLKMRASCCCCDCFVPHKKNINRFMLLCTVIAMVVSVPMTVADPFSSSSSSSVFSHRFSFQNDDDNNNHGIFSLDPSDPQCPTSRARIVHWPLSSFNHEYNDIDNDVEEDNDSTTIVVLPLNHRRKSRYLQQYQKNHRHDWDSDIIKYSNTLPNLPQSMEDILGQKATWTTWRQSNSPLSLNLHLEELNSISPEYNNHPLTLSTSSLSSATFPSTFHNNNNNNNNYQYSSPSLFLKANGNNNNNNNVYKKTGTTIAGCCVRNHVILAADTRATEGTMVADKTCQKLHQLSTNSWCCGAGTSADLDHLTKACLYSMALQTLQEGGGGGGGGRGTTTALSLSSSIGNGQDIDEEENETNNLVPAATDDDNHFHNSNVYSEEDDVPLLWLRPVSMDALCNYFQDALYKAQAHLGVNLILGGVWKGRAYLRALHPHGSMDVDLPFAALGSGGLAAMGVLEQGYRFSSSSSSSSSKDSDTNNNEMTVEEGIQLVQRAILAGIRNDLGSGSQVDMCIIRPDGTSHFQRCVVPEETLNEGYVAPDASIQSEDVEDDGTKAQTITKLGVNGFGNLPFLVQSKKTLFSNAIEEQRRSQWNELLGL